VIDNCYKRVYIYIFARLLNHCME